MASKMRASAGQLLGRKGVFDHNTRIITYQRCVVFRIVFTFHCKPWRTCITSRISCCASSVHAAPLLVTRHPRVHPLSLTILPLTASTEEPGLPMSSTTGPLPPLGTAAHLPPGGLITIAWCGVALAGVFGMQIFILEQLAPI